MKKSLIDSIFNSRGGVRTFVILVDLLALIGLGAVVHWFTHSLFWAVAAPVVLVVVVLCLPDSDHN